MVRVSDVLHGGVEYEKKYYGGMSRLFNREKVEAFRNWGPY